MRARLLLAALALGAAVVGGVAAADVVGTASNQCDNMAGTCIRERQQLAILVVRTVCVVALVAQPVDHLNDRWGGWLGA